MEELNKGQCEACRADAPRVTEAQMNDYLPQIPQWHVEKVDDVDHLVREFTFKNFVDALDFTNQVGELAEAHDHHPALLTEWGSVKISWWTHKIKGLHKNDFILAAKADPLYTA